MKITREWAMPNKKTFTIKPIKELLERVIPVYQDGNLCLDPFPLEYSKDATDYLNEKQDDCYYNAVFDPPYSPRQLKECYKGLGEYDTKASTWSNWKDLLSKKIKKGGIVISFGWSSQGMGISRGFEIQEILLVAHGGNHNDTICVVEKKIMKNPNAVKLGRLGGLKKSKKKTDAVRENGRKGGRPKKFSTPSKLDS